MEASSPLTPFDYELFEGDPDKLTTVDATPSLPASYVDPASLKLRYRIGHGTFGDVWVATHHQSTSDFEEYHEVVVKMLHPMREDYLNVFLGKFEELWIKLKSQQMQAVCWLHGISVVSGQICIALKSYEGSIGDRMALLKGGKLPLPDVLRYGIELAKGIQQLHQSGILVLNLKPNNFLLDENDHVVLGDMGIPHLLVGIPCLDPHLEFRLGTPNYMAPEQWEPGVRGPISYETDSWGFGCSVIEMLSGSPPWFRRSVEEMHHAVVVRQEKPQVPSGLPPAVEEVLMGCFEYDLRNRPLMKDVLFAFESSLGAVYNNGSLSSLGCNLYMDKQNRNGYSTWYLSKDHLQVGDTVRSRKGLYTGKTPSPAVAEGVVVRLDDDDGSVLVQLPNMAKSLRLNSQALERVTSGFAPGNWVRLIKGTENHSSLGILHHIQRDGSVSAGFLGLATLWRGHFSEIKVVEPFYVGQFVRLVGDVTTPRFEWPHRRRGGTWASGKISQIYPNGCLLITFPGRFVLGHEPTCFLADPEEVEHVTFGTCPGIVGKYELAEDLHWGVRPLAIAVGLFAAVRMIRFTGRHVLARRNNRNKAEKEKQNDSCIQEGQSSGSSSWLPHKVANILFNDGTQKA